MTIKEAIKYWEEFLKEIPEIVKEGFPQDEAEEQEQAAVMAIEALKESERGKCKECIINAPYRFCCKKECGEHEFCRGCDVRRNVMSRLTIRAEEDGVKAVWYGERDVFLEGEIGYAEADKLAHYEDLEEQLEKLYGGKMPLDKVVENLNRVIQNGEEKLDYARILTNAEAEKWGKWKDLEEQGRLIELPCAVGDMVYVIAPRYVECDKKYNCEDYNSEEYLITWCQNYCPNGYKGKGISPTKIEAIHIIEDGIDLSTTLGRYHIENVFTTREVAEAKLAEMEDVE